jgi:phage-related protein
MIAALVAAIAALFSPFVLIVGAIAAVTAAAYYLWTEFETVRTVVTTVFDAVRSVVEVVVENIIGRFTALWDMISGVVEAIRGLFSGDMQQVLDGLKEAFGGAIDFIYTTFLELPGKLLGFLADMLTKLGTWFATTGLPKFAEWSTKILDKLVQFAKDLPGTLFRLLSEAFERLGNFFTGTLIPKALEYGGKIGGAIIDGIVDGFNSLVSAAGGLAATLADAFVSAIKWVFNNVVADPVNSAVRGAVDSLDTLLGPFVNFPSVPDVIPRLADGGIVKSATLALIGEAGPEAVVPLDRGFGTGVVVNVSGALDPTSVAEQIRRILTNDARRRGGSVL